MDNDIIYGPDFPYKSPRDAGLEKSAQEFVEQRDKGPLPPVPKDSSLPSITLEKLMGPFHRRYRRG